MRAATAEQMREIDRLTSEEIGIPSIVLMENAARAVADVCEKELRDTKNPKVLIFAGKGNNGGDGLQEYLMTEISNVSWHFYLKTANSAKMQELIIKRQ